MYKYVSIVLRTVSVILSVIAGTIIGLNMIPVEPIDELPIPIIIFIIMGIVTIILLILQIIAAFFIQNPKFDFTVAVILIFLFMALWALNPDIKLPYICGIISNISLMLGNLKGENDNNNFTYQI
ncbi:hypothetical protein [Apilactobacillus micheneri]|uniref:hypothetical protein n=1 Tax=Apilactobacillus micheneri TaxID=1899430 RepID=UPI001128C4F2|nr:hypothetical protein [Apilactobacillus micheneri]TPR41480.1 hypothetical protein DY123_06295 [Apilactobacillus micheneri]TPR50400.1 hypothetical protein DY037_00160 [Apilactobacillus micheneri]TPR51057.1 hypothetical protein DY126_05820 [Apilactobacillus micheneri]